MSDGFQFRQFYVRHDRCAMKVGTDGVLLGAMASEVPQTRPEAPISVSLPPKGERNGARAGERFSILDLGCGCGLIALMLAQRFPEARIVAIDIDPDAASQARENVAASPWADRITIVEGDARISRFKEDNGQIAELSNGQIDLVVCNPPFYAHSPEAGSEQRNRARRTDTLTYDELARTASSLLREGGHLEVILPYECAGDFIYTCWLHCMHLAHRTDIRTTPARPIKRVVLRLRKGGTPPAVQNEEFTLLNPDGSRSEQYRALTRDFYINIE